MSIVRIGSVIAVLGCSGLRPALAQAVDEGLVVRQLKFSGNKSFEPGILKAAIVTTGSSFLATAGWIRWLGIGAKRHLNERAFRTDVERVKTFYRLHGYLDVLVDTAVVRTAKDAYITFRITENQPVRLRAFEIAGLDSIPDARSLTAAPPGAEARP